MSLDLGSESLDSESALAYLTNPASSSVLYTLSLQQPLTLKEIQAHPLRQHYLEMLTGKGGKPRDLRSVVGRGVDLGLLVPSTARREYYYFLNSDAGMRLPALTEEDGDPEVVLDRGPGVSEGEISLPPTKAMGAGHPIPLLRDPTTCLAWFDWLSDPRRRRVLLAIQEGGPLSRRDLATKGERLSLSMTRVGLRCGVLRLKGDRLDFPFARTGLPEGGVWTERPPRLWWTRSYEVLRCMQEWEAYVAPENGGSPMRALYQMIGDARKVLPGRRKRHLALNLLYEASAAIPSLEEVGPASLPSVWENRRGWVYPVRRGYQRAQMALALREELGWETLPGGRDLRPEALTRLAERRVGAYLKQRERKLAHRRHGDRKRGFGLGADAILSLASEELERGRMLQERKYFEAFLEVLRG